MRYQFGEFQIDAGRRELRLSDREVAVQPRVFDLIVFLIQHADRVVSKEELLEALWPGVVVVEGALQRVVSLARSALQQGGQRDAIRTYPKRGYRFCADISAAQTTVETAGETGLEQARTAFYELCWDAAVDGFLDADIDAPLVAADLERLAQALAWSGRAGEAIDPLQRAVAAHLSRGDMVGAARAAVWLAQIFFERLDLAVARGWNRRAATYLQRLPEGREHGLHAYLTARMALMDGDVESVIHHARKSHRLGLALEDSDLEGLGLTYMGHGLLASGEIARGIELQNEAAATVLAGETSAWAGAIIFCSVLWACRNRGDWERAAQWSEQFDRWCETNHMTAFPGTCVLHRAEVLAVRGKTAEAEREIRNSSANLSAWAPWAEGDAFRILGDLSLGRGELDTAASAYHRAMELGWDPQPGYAMLLIVRGEPHAAARALEASLTSTDWTNQERRGNLLAHLALALARAGDVERAEHTASELTACAELCEPPGVQAVLARARGEISYVRKDTETAIQALHRAVNLWLQVGSPLNAAHVRMRLAQILREAGDVPGTELQLTLAQGVFASQQAQQPLDDCHKLRRTLEKSREASGPASRG